MPTGLPDAAPAAAPAFRYRAFISYSHRDKAEAGWLHRALETYRVPKKLVGGVTRVGVVPRRLAPVFRDRDELSAADDLGVELTGALAQSRFLIVVCSPAAAVSRWVNEEVLGFKRLHGDSCVLALIVAGEPFSPAGRGDECFPPALRFRLGADGELSDRPAEPIAADLRASGDGRRAAKLKLVAGLTGVRLDDLVQRELQRRIRRLVAVAVAALVGMVFAVGLAFYANERRVEANTQRQIAEKESAAARAAADYLVGTFELANPATDNPRTITALSILGRATTRARQELADQPLIQLRLIETISRAYNNLGLLDEARVALESAQPLAAKAGADGAIPLLTLARTYFLMGRFDAARTAVARADQLLGPDLAEHAETRMLVAEMTGAIEAAAANSKVALAAYSHGIRLCSSPKGVAPGVCARLRANLGFLLSDMGRFDDAEAILLKANAEYVRTFGEFHRAAAQSKVALAQNAFLAGHLPLAETRINSALAVLRRVLDPDSLILADALSLQGQIFQSEGKPYPARAALEAAVAAYKKHFGTYHYLIGIADVYLALVESDLGHTKLALAHIDEARRNYDASYGKLHANHGDLLVNRARILAHAGRMPEARRDCAAGIAILGRTLGADAAFTKSLAKDCARLAPPATR